MKKEHNHGIIRASVIAQNKKGGVTIYNDYRTKITSNIIITTILQLVVSGIIMLIFFDISKIGNLSFKIKGVLVLILILADIFITKRLLNNENGNEDIESNNEYEVNEDIESNNEYEDVKKIVNDNLIKDEVSKDEVYNIESIEEQIDEMPYLIFNDSGVIKKSIINKDIFNLGRLDEKCDFSMPSPRISKVHARIEKRGENYFLKDLGSKNGTFVNGKRLLEEEEILLQHNCIITLANISIKFINMKVE